MFLCALTLALICHQCRSSSNCAITYSMQNNRTWSYARAWRTRCVLLLFCHFAARAHNRTRRVAEKRSSYVTPASSCCEDSLSSLRGKYTTMEMSTCAVDPVLVIAVKHKRTVFFADSLTRHARSFNPLDCCYSFVLDDASCASSRSSDFAHSRMSNVLIICKTLSNCRWLHWLEIWVTLRLIFRDNYVLSKHDVYRENGFSFFMWILFDLCCVSCFINVSLIIKSYLLRESSWLAIFFYV